MKDKEKKEVQPENIWDWEEPEEKEMTKEEFRMLLLQWIGILALAIVVVRTLLYVVNRWLGIE